MELSATSEDADPDKHLQVPHIKQQHNWDCGLACTLMVLRSQQLAGTTLQDLYKMCGTKRCVSCLQYSRPPPTHAQMSRPNQVTIVNCVQRMDSGPRSPAGQAWAASNLSHSCAWRSQPSIREGVVLQDKYQR